MLLETPNPDIPVSKGAPVGPSAPAAMMNWRPTIEFISIVVQLALLALLIWRYHLESPAFIQLTLLIFGGFAVHYFFPLAYRLPFFVALSSAGIVLVLG